MQHRVANSLQIIASILLLKAKAVSSDEARLHLKDAHQRVMSVAAVQQHLRVSTDIDKVEVGSYLNELCASLTGSMVSESQPIEVTVTSDSGMVASDDAVGVGLIVTELLINAIKYAFPGSPAGARITVGYKVDAPSWTLSVVDNGIGKSPSAKVAKNGGLGTVIVEALVKQLQATMAITSSADGTAVTISRHAEAAA